MNPSETPQPESPVPTEGSIESPSATVPAQIPWRQNPWLVFLLPFFIYMALGSLEPSPAATPDDKPHFLGLLPGDYPYIYAIKLAATLVAVAWIWPGYPRFTRFSLLSIIVGAVGVVLWIALARFQQWSGFNSLLSHIMTVERPSFNPWNSDLAKNVPQAVWLFVGIRFIGLAFVVPIIEEMFLRGFVMRFPVQDKWWDVPWGTVTRNALIVGTVIPVLLHPGEILGAVVWFGLIHWLYARTKNVWDCVIAHGVTNFLLGVYVVRFEEWWLW